MPEPAPPTMAYRIRVLARLGTLIAGLSEPIRGLATVLVANPGKCVRSTLLGACAGLGRPDPDRVIRLGAVVELVHLASLLHDDVIDRADVRRGRATAHSVAGGGMAMLAGLSCFALAGSEAADLDGGVDRLVGETIAELAYGELLDVERAFDPRLSLVDYLELVDRKTGALFRVSCVLGAAEAGFGPADRRVLGRFGAHLGIAFQILDDCLDLAPDAVDKPTGTDLMLGLFGAPALCALRNDRDRALTALLLSPALTREDLPKARALIVARGGLDAATRLAVDTRQRALSTLDGLADEAARDALTAVAATVWHDPR